MPVLNLLNGVGSLRGRLCGAACNEQGLAAKLAGWGVRDFIFLRRLVGLVWCRALAAMHHHGGG